MTAQILFHQLTQSLSELYDSNEAKSIAYLVLDARYGLTRTQVLMDMPVSKPVEDLPAIIERLKNQEPVQYVLGEEDFYGRTFKVAPGVLIPRPETEELVHWALQELKSVASPRLLDIGTGTGCIALTMAAERPDAEVTAFDISGEALTIARENARRLAVPVQIQQGNALQEEDLPQTTFDVILSNPPYVKASESQEMSAHVLEHEPHLALFVEDNDPLIFYRAIAQYAFTHLNRQGFCAVEINQALGSETVEVFTKAGFSNVELRQDLSGRDRMIMARI